MGRGENDLLYNPPALIKDSRKYQEGIPLPGFGQKIFALGKEVFVFLKGKDWVLVDLAKKEVQSAEPLSHTNKISASDKTLVAFHENGIGLVGIEDMNRPTVGIYHQGKNYLLGIPMLSQNQRIDAYSLQALRDDILFYQPDQVKLSRYSINDALPSDDILDSSNWFWLDSIVSHFFPGESGAFFIEVDASDPIPTYIDSYGREHSADFWTLEEFSNFGECQHAPAGGIGEVYFVEGSSLRTLSFPESSASSPIKLPGHPKKITSSKDGHLALLYQDKFLLVQDGEIVQEEKLARVEDILFHGDSLLILRDNEIIEKELSDI